MKFSRLFSLAFAACCALAATVSAEQPSFTPCAELGNVMYVGDSITHGVDSASYRWPLFKIWVDNGIAQQEVGVNAGNWRGGVPRNTPYGGAVFLNVHSAISSERAYEIAGRINKSGRLENSNIHDWLGLDESYSGKRRIDPRTQKPATFFLLIGTNDTLSDSGKAGIHSCVEEKVQNLLGKRLGKGGKGGGDLQSIIAAMRVASPGARIAVCTIPCWMDGRGNNDAAEDFAAIVRYNELLKSWGKAQNVAVVEVNRGLVDVFRSEEKPFVGAASMFVRDRLHPSPQGDLIIAGNIAQQLGYAGRTAGLARKGAAGFPRQAAAFSRNWKKGLLSLEAGETLIYRETGAAGKSATVEFSLAKKGYGNGARGGWEADKSLELTLTTTAGSGTLSLSEGGIQWDGRMLYSADMSKPVGSLRLAYRPEDSARHIPGGFYVWLGDMLIGEALPATLAPESTPGFSLSASYPTLFSTLSYDPAAAWAPASKRFSAVGGGKP